MDLPLSADFGQLLAGAANGLWLYASIFWSLLSFIQAAVVAAASWFRSATKTLVHIHRRYGAYSLIKMATIGSTLWTVSPLRDAVARIRARFQRHRVNKLVVLRQPSSQPTQRLVWVHGTWGAPFHRSSHSLIQHLAESDPNAVIYGFSWDGQNSRVSRQNATRDLGKFVEEMLSDDVPTVLIGHSHGGTMAYEAACAPNLSRRVRVITLAAPFIDVSKLMRSEGAFLTGIPFLHLFFVYYAGCIYFFWLLNLTGYLLFDSDIASVEVERFATAALLGSIPAILGLTLILLIASCGRARSANSALPQYPVRRQVYPHTISIRTKGDPLLNSMIACSKAHLSRMSTAEMLRRTEVPDEGPVIIDLLTKSALGFIVGLFILKSVTVVRYIADLEIISRGFVFWLWFIVSSAIPTFLYVKYPIRLGINTARSIGRLPAMLSPIPTVLAIAQSGLTGWSILDLMSKRLRIYDCPLGATLEHAAETEIVKNAWAWQRHSKMLCEPDVLTRVGMRIAGTELRS